MLDNGLILLYCCIRQAGKRFPNTISTKGWGSMSIDTRKQCVCNPQLSHSFRVCDVTNPLAPRCRATSPHSRSTRRGQRRLEVHRPMVATVPDSMPRYSGLPINSEGVQK